MDRSRYPADWEKISYYIRFCRARGKCEWCGAENSKPHPVTGSIVILTVAHLDHDPENTPTMQEVISGHPKADRLKALCQRCHLRHDRKRHMVKRMITAAEKTGQPFLITEGLEL